MEWKKINYNMLITTYVLTSDQFRKVLLNCKKIKLKLYRIMLE